MLYLFSVQNGVVITHLRRVAHYSALLASFYAKTDQLEKAKQEYDIACDQLEYLYSVEDSVSLLAAPIWPFSCLCHLCSPPLLPSQYVSQCFLEKSFLLERMGHVGEGESLRVSIQLQSKLVGSPSSSSPRKDVYMQILTDLAKEYAQGSERCGHSRCSRWRV